jgi:hypothetical protein
MHPDQANKKIAQLLASMDASLKHRGSDYVDDDPAAPQSPDKVWLLKIAERLAAYMAVDSAERAPLDEE